MQVGSEPNRCFMAGSYNRFSTPPFQGGNRGSSPLPATREMLHTFCHSKFLNCIKKKKRLSGLIVINRAVNAYQ